MNSFPKLEEEEEELESQRNCWVVRNYTWLWEAPTTSTIVQDSAKVATIQLSQPPQLSKDPKEPLRKCGSNVKFQPEPSEKRKKNVRSALAVTGEESVVLCLERLTKGSCLSRRWQAVWRQLPVQPAFRWRGLRCGGSWNRRAPVQICGAEAKEEKTEQNNNMPPCLSLLLLLCIPTKLYF